jgi:hypothetical protein
VAATLGILAIAGLWRLLAPCSPGLVCVPDPGLVPRTLFTLELPTGWDRDSPSQGLLLQAHRTGTEAASLEIHRVTLPNDRPADLRGIVVADLSRQPGGSTGFLGMSWTSAPRDVVVEGVQLPIGPAVRAGYVLEQVVAGGLAQSEVCIDHWFVLDGAGYRVVVCDWSWDDSATNSPELTTVVASLTKSG